MKPQCLYCQWWHPVEFKETHTVGPVAEIQGVQSKLIPISGECRAQAPLQVMVGGTTAFGRGHWPYSQANGWCGQFKERTP
jgi:hypothetical protein